MSSPDTPLSRIAARFGYHLDDNALMTPANLPAVDIQAAALCATLIENVDAVTDPDLRYALSQDREAARLTGGLDDTVAAIEHAYRAVAALLDTAVSAGMVRQRGTDGARVPADPDTWMPVVVRVAGSHGGPYPCQVMRHRRWNGWAIPRFTRDVTVRLLADLTDGWNRHSQHPGYLRGGLRSSVGDAVLASDDENFDFVAPDEHGMYAIGAGRWCWEEWPT